MTFSEAIDDYRTAARHELGHSQSTYYSDVATLQQFARWLDANGQPDPLVDEITPQLLKRLTTPTLIHTGEQVFATAWAQGRAMTLGVAVSHALAETDLSVA